MPSIRRGRMVLPGLLNDDKPSPVWLPLLLKMNFRIIRRIDETGVTVLLVGQNVKQALAIAHQDYVMLLR